MKRFIRAGLLAAVFLTAGCADPYIQKIEELEDRVADLQLACDQINSDINALQKLVKAIEEKDMITGVTELRSGTTVTGYRINFVNHAAVTITNGQDGKRPLVSSQRDPDDGNWYWTVQYGDGNPTWLLAPDGTKMLAIGVLPYVTIRDGWFCLTMDGVNWTRLDKADGENGDQMFKSVNTGNDNYVTFTLTDGTSFRIPTYRVYLQLKEEIEKINDDTDAQTGLVVSTIDKFLYITNVSTILVGKDTVGLSVTLSDGKNFTIRDWTTKLSPAIFIKQDSDGKFYWAYSIGSSAEQWVLAPDGSKISAASETVTVPRVSVTQDRDGQFYWTVTTGDNTEFLRYLVDSTWTPRAVDSVARSFLNVRNYSDSLVVVLKDSTTRFVLPKQYSVTIETEITLRDGQERRIPYTAYGPDVTLALIAQGGVTAREEIVSGEHFIRVKAAEPLSAGAKVMAFFTFQTTGAPVTVERTVIVKKED